MGDVVSSVGNAVGSLFGGGGGSQSAPAAPNYTAAAQATAQGNLENAKLAQVANMVNQYTPQGSVTYKPIGTVDGFTQWGQTVEMAPQQKALYDQAIKINQGLGDVSERGLGYVQQALSQPLQSPGQAVGTAGTTQFKTGVNAPNLQTQIGDAGQVQGGIQSPTVGLVGGVDNTYIQRGIGNNAAWLTTETGANQQAGGYGYNPQAQSRIDSAGNVVGNIDNNAANIRTSVNDPSLLNKQVQDALYQQQTQYLDPQFQKSQSRLENQLANQGITRGSEAWNSAMQEAGMQRQQAYESARNSAISGATQAASTLYGNQLAGMQAGNTALGQQFGQNVTEAQLANAAQGQRFGQNQAQQQAYNAAQAQNYAQGLQNQQLFNQAAAQNNALAQSNAAFQNQALGQQFNQGLQAGQFGNQASAQQFSQNLQAQQAQNQARQQQLQEALATGQFTNEAQAQKYQQELQRLQAQNDALSQQFNMGISNANLANQAAQQQYAQQLSNAQLQNQAINQNFANAQTLRQDPINMLNAVRSGQQMTAGSQPQVAVSAPGMMASVAGADILGATQAGYNAQLGAYNAQNAAQSGMLGGLGSMALGGASLWKAFQ